MPTGPAGWWISIPAAARRSTAAASNITADSVRRSSRALNLAVHPAACHGSGPAISCTTIADSIRRSVLNPINDFTNQGSGFGYLTYALDADTSLTALGLSFVHDFGWPATPDQPQKFPLAGVPD